MPGERRGALRLVLSISMLAVGLLLALKLGVGLQYDHPDEISATLLASPEFRVEYGRTRLSVSATTASSAHEAALLAVAADQFKHAQVETEFRAGLLLQPEWEIASARLLYLVAATSSATAIIDDAGIRIRGVSDDPEGFQSRLQFLQDALANKQQIDANVMAIAPTADLQDLCAQNFAAIADPTNVAQAIHFHQAGTELSNAAAPLLDRLAEFAYDCRDHRIAILGHTDSTGPADWNLKVSEARAQAVAAQLLRRGIARDRLLVEGHGAQTPLADNATVQGRARNRRIEFELR